MQMMNTSSSIIICRRVAASILKNSPNRNPRIFNRPNFRNPNFNLPKTLRTVSSTIMEGNSGVGQNSTLLSSSSAANGGGVSVSNGGGDNKLPERQFALSPSSVLKIQKGDITQWFVDGASDAIVNAANEKMLGGGGVDGAIHRAAGPELRAACYEVAEVRPTIRCPRGEARITPAFRLPVSRVIHTVGPIYDMDNESEVSLRNSYRNSLRLAKENNIQYIAFPAISCGVYLYPFEEAATIAISTVTEFAADFKEVHFVLFSDDIYNVWLEKANGLL